MIHFEDPVLKSIVSHLTHKYGCHTVILYGSRARGLATSTSDYDVVGICKSGAKTRITKKQNGFYWDVFVYPEKDLRKLGSDQLAWKGAKLLFRKGSYGNKLISRIKELVKKPYEPIPKYEIDALKVWAQKELDRCKKTDTHGLYRRAEFQSVLLKDYFLIRKKKFWGPKEAIQWLKKKDTITYKLLTRSLKSPTNLTFLKLAATHIYKIKLTD
jgi:predicted nucleotidyltransferase